MRKTLFEKCMQVHLSGIAMAIIIMILPAISLKANAAEKVVSGVVLSITDNTPLIGVSVVEKGSTNGTVTDIDGKYSIEVKDGTTLIFSYVGFLSQEIEVGDKSFINIKMAEGNMSLNEVVVVGYGVQKKKLVTGATVQVKGEDLQKFNTTSVVSAMQGQTPGVNITTTSGQPGADMKVVIRGIGTVGSSGPLYIVDGIQTGDIKYLNNSDIESVDVLKDAASAAIYGSQAANGVVLITTKSGTKGKGQITFDGYYGIQQPTRSYRMLNTSEYKHIMNEQAINSGKSAINWADYDLQDVDTDWVGQMTVDDAVMQNYVIGAQGGTDNSIYSMSIGYTGQEGIVGGSDVSDYKRYTFRSNTDHKIYGDYIKAGQHLTFARTESNGVSDGNQYVNTLRESFGVAPFIPVRDGEGNYYDNSNSLWYNSHTNPYGLMMMNNFNESKTHKLIGDVYVEINPFKGLKFRSSLGYDLYTSTYRSSRVPYKFNVNDIPLDQQTSSVSQSASSGYAISVDNVLSYHFDLDEKKHSFDLMAGHSARKYKGDDLSLTASNLRNSIFKYAYLSNSDATSTSIFSGSPQVENSTLSYFGRVAYNYREKYMLNATFRADGSSRFAKGNRWGYFPSVSAGWTLSNEEFLLDSSDWLDNLKLRASWGQVGNQNIGDYKYLALVSNSDCVYNFGTTEGIDGNTVGYYPITLANPDIKWETSEQLNFGFDASIMAGRLNFVFDWYKKTTKDWLVDTPVRGDTGFSTKTINGGDVKNTGFEFAANWRDKIGEVGYSIGANIAYNKNEVGKIPTADGIIHGKDNLIYNNSTEFYRAENGHAIGYFWGYKTAGIFQNEQEINEWKSQENGILQSDPKPGDVKYVDLDGDGVINENDKTDLGNPMPDYSYGFNFTVEYKGFDLSVNANGVIGNKIVQSYRNQADAYANYTTAVLNRWHGEGTSNRYPRVTESNINWQFSDLYVQDGDYLRISNITLGYDFTDLIKCKYISQCRVYLQAQNPFTFTKYDGMDPEIGWGDSDFGSGIDVGQYPRAKSYLIGVNLKF